jgi:DNA-binding beta-propeller fold protein YncE
VALAFLCACATGPREPTHYLVITHSALNRVTFFDLDRMRVVGALPAQKLPHDLLLSHDQRTIVVVNSGAQCITAYHLDAPELWRRARDFMRRDTTPARPRSGGGMTEGGGGPDGETMRHPAGSSSAPIYLNPDPVQDLPPAVADFHLTDPTFPDSMRAAHARVRAGEHHACFDCHARAHGGKPFGPTFSSDGRSIRLVHLDYRNVTELDAGTLAVLRRIPLDLPSELSPVEIWVEPGTDTAFVTCRNRIGETKRGRIEVVDLGTGRRIAIIPVGIYPWHLVPDPSGRRLLVDNFQSSRISIVDVARRAVVDSIVAQNGPSTMAFLPGGAKLLVSCFYTHRLLVVDAATHRVESAIPVGSNPTSLLVAADGSEALVLCGGESEIDRVDLRAHVVRERYPVLFGAYAFQVVDRDHSGRWLSAAGTVVP